MVSALIARVEVADIPVYIATGLRHSTTAFIAAVRSLTNESEAQVRLTMPPVNEAGNAIGTDSCWFSGYL